jgi:hypothetical protein
VWLGYGLRMAAAALVVAITGRLTEQDGAVRDAKGPASADTQSVDPQQSEMLDDGADRAFCIAIGPLMVESQDTRKVFQAAGPKNSSERRAVIPKFKTDTNNCAKRMQQQINENSAPLDI